MKFLAIIPARFQSSRFPGKPLARIGGVTMIQRVYERVAAHFGDCWVATDDSRIVEAVERFGGRVVTTSADHRSGTDRCAEAHAAIARETGREFDVVVNVQGDEPFISGEHLEKIQAAFGDGQVQIATLVKLFRPEEDIFNPNTPKVVVSQDGYALYFSRSPIPYLRDVPDRAEWVKNHGFYKHIGLYAYRTDVLGQITELPHGALERAESLEQLRWLENGYRVKVEEVTTETVAVDTPEDLEKALAMLPSY